MNSLDFARSKHSPLNKGRQEGILRGFTLVELIVVVTILAILGTIAFISLQGYSQDARDSKRISDTRSLISKITIENTKGTSYSEIMNENGKDTSLTINGTSQTGSQNIKNPINRNVLKENEENFTDPTNGHPYPFAYATGEANKQLYNFTQLAYVSEKTGGTKLVGNYYEMQHGDSPSLFTKEGKDGTIIPDDYITDNGEPIYDIGVSYTPPPSPSCEQQPNYNADFYAGNPTEVNQPWQNSDINSPCYYKCLDGYVGPTCINDLVHISHWNNFVSRMDTSRNVTYATSTIDIPTGYYGDEFYYGGIYTKEGKVVFVPLRSKGIIIFDPVTKGIETVDIPGVGSAAKWAGVVYTKEGKVVFVPSQRPDVLIFDPVTKDFENVTVDVQTDIWKFIGAVYTPEGKVVATPHGADYVLIFDPVTYEYEKVTMPTGYSGNSRRTGGVVTREGKVVFIPAKSDTIVIFDPIAKTFDTVNSGSTGDYKRQGGTLDPSTGNVIFYSNAANKMLHFNPTTKAIATYGLGGNYPVGGTITKEGKIVLAPCNYNDIIIYDVTTHTVQKIATGLTGDKKFSGAVYTKEGNVVFIPNHYSKILMLNISPSLTQPQPIEDFINAYVNKY